MKVETPWIIDAIRDARPVAVQALAEGLEDPTGTVAHTLEEDPDYKRLSAEAERLMEQHAVDAKAAARLSDIMGGEMISAAIDALLPLGIAIGLLLNPSILDAKGGRK